MKTEDLRRRVLEHNDPAIAGHSIPSVLGTVAIVFLIACANVASLFTVRAENRRRDLVVRRALGAQRGDLLRSQVTEALLLAAAGGAAGALIAWVGVPLLVRAAPDAVAGGFVAAPIPGLATAGLDLTALLFTVGISVLAACAFGLLPALALLRLAAWQPSAGRTRHRRRESHARCVGGRADRCCARPAGWIGAAHAQLLAAP